MRSSKLAAMAANIKKSQQQQDEQEELEDVELDLDLDDFSEQRPQKTSKRNPVKLENIMDAPDTVEEYLEEASCQSTGLPSNVSSLSAASNCSGSPINNAGSPGDPFSDMGKGSFGNVDFAPDIDVMQDSDVAGKSQQNQQQQQQDRSMSLRCVNSGSAPDTNYRLGLT